MSKFRDELTDLEKKRTAKTKKKKLSVKQQRKIDFINEGLVDALAELDMAKPKKSEDQLDYREKRAHLILRAGEMRAATYE